MEAKIIECGNGYPTVGCYVAGGGVLYLVKQIWSTVFTDLPGLGNYVYAEVEEADWSDCNEGEEFPAAVRLTLRLYSLTGKETQT